MKVFLDMDGVIADFTAGVCTAFGVSFSNKEYPFPRGLWDYVDYFKCYHEIDWDAVKVVCSQATFWANLPALPKANRLYQHLNQNHSIHFLTTPTGAFGPCFEGKRKWLESRGWAVSHDKRMTLLEPGETKKEYACSDTILLDDQDKNVQDFRHGGGRAILVPRPWNNRHRECRGTTEFEAFNNANSLVVAELEEF